MENQAGSHGGRLEANHVVCLPRRLRLLPEARRTGNPRRILDFEGSAGAVALAMILEEHQASNTSWELFDESDSSLGSFQLSDGGAGAQFYGVISDVAIARAVVTHSTSENFAIGTQYFVGAAVPEPTSVPLACLALAAVFGSRRRRA